MDFQDFVRFKGFKYHHTLTERSDPDQFNRHCHNQYELIYICQGKGSFQVEGNTYRLYPGCFLVFRPQEFHCIRIDPSTPYERYVVHFYRSNIFENAEELLAIFENRDLGFSNLYADPNGTLPGYFHRLDDCLEYSDPNRSTMAKLVLNELLVTLNARYYLTGDNVNAEKLIHRIVAYINENLSNPMKTEDLAKQFFISRPYLSHMFKKHTGLSVSDYISRKRLTMAQGLLRDGVSAIDAANQCGYTDYSVFYRAYKKFYDKNPSEDRITTE